jgi:hypothetical protein
VRALIVSLLALVACTPADASRARLTKHVSEDAPRLWQLDEEMIIAGTFPIGFFGSQRSTSIDLSTGPSSDLSTARTGGNLYVTGGTADTATLVGTNTAVWEDHHDGGGGGLWAGWDAWSNLYPSPLAAGTLASGAHAGGDYGSGLVYTNTANFFYDFSSHHHAARKINTAGTVQTVASPWGGFGNALSIASLGNNNRALEFNGDAFALPNTFNVAMKIKPTNVTGTSGAAFGKFGCCSASHQPFVVLVRNDGFYCSMTDGGGTFRLAQSTTLPVNNTTYDLECDFDATNLRIFINGTLEQTLVTAGNITGNATTIKWEFGNDDDEGGGGTLPFDGLIDELRISNVSRHTSNYTPAASPFTSDANTLVLMHFDNLLTPYDTGYSDPIGGTGAVRLLSSENNTRIGINYAAGGTGEASLPTASAWVVDEPTYAPSPSAGALSSVIGDNPPGAISLGTGASFRRVFGTYYKSGIGSDAWNAFPAGTAVAPAPLAGDAWVAAASNIGAGGVHVWGPQISIQSASDLPLLDGSSSAAVTTLAAGKLSRVLQSNGDLYVRVSYLHDPWQVTPSGTVGTPRDIFSYVNADGTTALGFNNSSSIHMVVNGSVPVSDGGNAFNEVSTYYQGYGESEYGFFVRPGSDGKQGNTQRTNGCLWYGQSIGAAPTMHAPTSFYLGSNAGGANTAWPRRYTFLSFDKFDESAAEGIVIGNSLLAEYTGHVVVGSWIYSLSEARTRSGIYNLAAIGATTAGQKAALDASIYATDPTHANAIKYAIIMETLNCMDSGTVASCSTDMQNLVNDVHTKLPNAHIYVWPTIPCANGASCIWANVDNANACVEGSGGRTAQCTGAGGTSLTCPGGATCHFYTYASTWGPSGSSPMDDGTATGKMLAGYSLGDRHENDLGGKVMGKEYSAKLRANGDLP